MPEEMRFAALLLVMVIAFVHFIVPMVRTFIPLINKWGLPSWVLFWRIATRFNLFLLALIQVAFSARALGFIEAETQEMRSVVVIIWAAIGVSIVASWITHPSKVKGL